MKKIDDSIANNLWPGDIIYHPLDGSFTILRDRYNNNGELIAYWVIDNIDNHKRLIYIYHLIEFLFYKI